jgi:hypothetical protein
MRNKKAIFFTVFFFLFILSFNNLSAQNTSPKTALELSKGNKIKYVKPGKKARIWYEGQKYKVYIDSIGPDKIFTKEKNFEINKTNKIAIKFKATIITGSIIGTAGLLFTGLGTTWIIKGYQSNDLGGVLLIVFGFVVDAVAVPVTAIGSGIIFIGKKYKRNKGWNFKAVQIE